MTGDKELDQTIRSFSSAFMSRRKILNNAGNNAGWISKRPRHFAARYRLVSQAVGQRGAQRVAALVKDIRHLRLECRKLSSEQEGQESAVRNIQSSLIVDAWENTPLDDLKNMNWEELLREGQEHVDAFRLWQQSTI